MKIHTEAILPNVVEPEGGVQVTFADGGEGELEPTRALALCLLLARCRSGEPAQAEGKAAKSMRQARAVAEACGDDAFRFEDGSVLLFVNGVGSAWLEATDLLPTATAFGLARNAVKAELERNDWKA